MTQEEDSASNLTTLILGICGFLLYWWFLRPTMAAPPTGNPQGQGTMGQGTMGATNTGTRTGGSTTPRGGGAWNTAGGAGARQPQQTRMTRIAPKAKLSEAAAEVLGDCQTKPSHVQASKEVAGLGGSNLLTESGLVAYMYTSAATTTTTSTTSQEDAASLRQERAKIWSNLCSIKTPITPPPRGSTLVVALSQADLPVASSPSSLPRVLYVLATFYNLVVLVNVSASGTPSKSDIVQQLRGTALSESVLPTHRILLATTVAGRVALVRQLSKVALVIDWDEQVETQLTRFGHQVLLVQNWNTLVD